MEEQIPRRPRRVRILRGDRGSYRFRSSILIHIKDEYEKYGSILDALRMLLSKELKISEDLLLPIEDYFPAINFENAKRFGAQQKPYLGELFWKTGEWSTGRLDFLKWLIKYYQDNLEKDYLKDRIDRTLS